jgi:hypothetical protein
MRASFIDKGQAELSVAEEEVAGPYNEELVRCKLEIASKELTRNSQHCQCILRVRKFI